MKLPIKITKTSFVEFDTPCYYECKWSGTYYKIYETGLLKVNTDTILNAFINDTTDSEYWVKQIRELLETGIPITKEQFYERYTITSNHLNIIAS